MILRAVPAVTRAAAILRLLGRARAPMGVKAISQELGLIPSTALHILRALVVEELVKVDPLTKHYSLGAGVLSLARTALRSNDFPTLVQPGLDALSRRYGVTAIGLELPNLQHMIGVALSRTEAPMRLHVDVGSRFPALISATGRCLAAFTDYPKAEIEKRFRALRWNNAPSYEAWSKEVETARRQGFSIARGNYIAGVTIVAVPVPNARGPISRSLASVGIAGQLDRARSVELARDMQDTAKTVAASLA